MENLEDRWNLNKEETIKYVFMIGDVRNGTGNREDFKKGLDFLAEKSVLSYDLIRSIPDYNRWDVVFYLHKHKQYENIIYDITYNELMKGNSLCAKWMPRKKQISNFGLKFRRYWKLTPKEYRNLIVQSSNTIEQKMCAKEYSKIEYSKIPKKAKQKYTKFLKKWKKKYQT